MAYTVKQLARLSGVSVRTLHWYDKKRLLKAAYHGANGYRYYEEEQLLLLQQILFFKKLGFSLKDIQKLLLQPDFDKVKALEEHRQFLTEHIKRTKILITTIDKTLLHLRGEEMMKLEAIFEGFTEEKQQHYVDYLEKKGVNRQIIEQSKLKTKHWNKNDWLAHKKAADKVHTDLIAAINNGDAPESHEVQNIIKTHYELTCKHWTPDRSSYSALAELYGSHDDFVAFYQNLHPQLLGFLQAAMCFYAEKNLSYNKG
jgi:DNA-binding transcriptional MerR regulator